MQIVFFISEAKYIVIYLRINSNKIDVQFGKSELYAMNRP